jgi:uncharacterized protein
MGSIFNMFGPSPIKPIERHMRKAHNCVKALHSFFEAVLKEDWNDAQDIQLSISKFEKEADAIKKELRLHLPTGLFLPVSRSDLLELLNVQDKLANKAEDIAGLIVGRKMVIPRPLINQFMPFVDKCIQASKQACKAINELDELLESGFRGNEVHIVEEMIVKLDIIEHESDDMLATMRHQIFQLEKELPAVDVFFLYKIVQWIGDLADHAQTVGGRLQILIAR